MRPHGAWRIAVGSLSVLGLAACSHVLVSPSETSGSGGEAGLVCPEATADCDGDGTCETTLGTIDDCGSCGDSCSSHDGTPSCQNGQCTIACNAGYADCNGDASDGCESPLDHDPENCGACGAACAPAGDCFQQTCLDILTSAPAAAVGADAIVIEGSELYWSTPGVNLVGEIARVPITGGAAVPLLTGVHAPERLRSNGQWLVWSDFYDAGVYRMQLPLGPLEIVHQEAGTMPHVLDVDDSVVYFTTGTNVEAVPIAGGTPTVLASGFFDVSEGHLHAGVLYIADRGPELLQPEGSWGHPEGTIHRLDLGTLALSLIAEQLDTPTSITSSADAIYWAETGSMATGDFGEQIDANVGTLGRVARAGLGGENAIVLAADLVQPWDVAVDETHVYIANAGTVGGKNPSDSIYVSDGNLLRVPIAGGAVETFMPSIDARNVTLSRDAVFFASYNYGLIMRKSK